MKAYLSIQAKSGLLSQSFIKLTLAIYLLGLQHIFFFFLYCNTEDEQHLQTGKGYLFPGLCSLFKEHVLLLDKICEILRLINSFSCLNTVLLPYLILSLAGCVRSRCDTWGVEMWFMLVFAGSDLWLLLICCFLKGRSTYPTPLGICCRDIFSEAYSVL